MSKNKTKKPGQVDPEPSARIRKDVKEIKTLDICPIDSDVKLGKLNSVLLVSYIKDQIIGRSLVVDEAIEISLYGKPQNFQVVNLSGDFKDNSSKTASEETKSELSIDKDPTEYVVTKKTVLNLLDTPNASSGAKARESASIVKSLKDSATKAIPVIGLDDEKNKLLELISLLKLDEATLQKAHAFLPIKGAFVYGPSGVGKTALIKDLAISVDGVEFLLINTRDLLSKYVGESETKISEIFQEAKSVSPCVLIFDDFHVLSFKKDIGSENSSMMLNAVLNEMDNITSTDRVLAIAITDQITRIEPALRRAGRFEKEVKIEVPNANKRLEVVKSLIKVIPNSLSLEDIAELNTTLNGYTGADIMALIREAIFRALNSTKTDSNLFREPSAVSTEVSESQINKTQIENTEKLPFVVSKTDLEEARAEVNPSGLKDIIAEIPKVFWRDIGGYESVKSEIKKVIEWPLKHPEAFERMGIKPSKGVLLYGPPGCSKTMIAKAIATESKLNFIAIKGPELFNKYVGESEKAIRELFKRARLCSPCVIFFDEIDAIATQRSVNTDVSERVLIQLLTEMDGMESAKHVIVIAATNRPDVIDTALMRPGRFDHLILVSVPNEAAREEILRINTVGTKMPLEDDVEVNKLAQMTNRYSGAEIVMICREAALTAMDRDLFNAKVSLKDFEHSLSKNIPRIKDKDIKFYEEFASTKKLF